MSSQSATVSHDPSQGYGRSTATPGTTHASRLSRVAPLDGLRAIAILIVVAHHVGGSAGPLNSIALRLWTVIVNAGWTGVQLFFVLSGFLITRILLNSKGADGWIKNFYARRVLRIFPLYYALVAMVYVVAPRVSLLSRIADHGTIPSLWYWAYLSNWVSPFGRIPVALLHAWSLAVEEQFYMLWPLVIAVVSERTLAKVCLLMVAGAYAVRIGLHFVFPRELAAGAAYELTIARFDTITMGALVAIVVRNAKAVAWLAKRIVPAIAVVVVALMIDTIIWRSLWSHGNVAELITQPLTAVLSALMVFACVSRSSQPTGERIRAAGARWLSAGWLRAVARYSYGIYIVHVPMHVLLRPMFAPYMDGGSATRRLAMTSGYTACVFGTSMLFAVVSWHVIEQPFLSLKRFFPMPSAGDAVHPGDARVLSDRRLTPRPDLSLGA